MRRTFLAPFLAASLLLMLVAGPAAARPASVPGNAPTIASTAIAAGSFSTLVAAVSCTPGLLEAIDSPTDPQLTVFAPTDDAFLNAIPGVPLNAGNVCTVDGLAEILADHIVPGRYSAGRVLENESLTALSGRSLSVADDLLPKLNLELLDLHTSNGVIHVLDQVILPAG
jgi:uncharacterized surface protein with fasciclin (FAS1) repeats